jgi:hypothetical protein
MSAAEHPKLNPRCVYADGRVDGVYVVPLPCEIARYLVVYRGEYYAFTVKDEVREFLKERLGREVTVAPC